jgi:hypothetical protein
VCGLLGLALMLRRRVEGAGLFALVFVLLPLPYYLVTVQPRFRHPMEPLIAVLAVYLFRSTEEEGIRKLGLAGLGEAMPQQEVLVTGGSGFFGGVLKRRLLAEGFAVTNIDLVRDEDAGPRG